MTRPVDRPALGRVPVPLGVVAAVALVFLVLPLVGLMTRVPWSDLWSILDRDDVLEALRLSALTATAAAGLCILVGVPLAWLLARTDFHGRRVLRALVTIPLVLPPVVGGVALLTALGRRGLVGSYLDLWFGVQIPFTTVAVVLAQTFVALPFLVLSVEGSLRTADPRYDEVSATLGASRAMTFWRVTVPLALPGIASGAVLAWARALGEFGATITFAGNTEGVTRTTTLLVYKTFQTDSEAAYALSFVLLLACVAVLASMRERWLGGLR